MRGKGQWASGTESWGPTETYVAKREKDLIEPARFESNVGKAKEKIENLKQVYREYAGRNLGKLV